MASARHEEHEEHVNHEAWVIPYADMVTLLFAMFLMLFVTSQADQERFETLANNIRSEIGTVTLLDGGQVALLDGGPSLAGGAASAADVLADELSLLGGIGGALDLNGDGRPDARADGRRLEDVEAAVDDELERAGFAKGTVDLHRSERGITVDISADGILFAPGTATLTGAGEEIIDTVAPVLAGLPNHLVVEGHTDSAPISTPTFPSNWELSSARAGAVLRHLLGRADIPASRLSSAGYADTRPVADNATAAGRSQNRRVEIVIVNTNSVGGAGLPAAGPRALSPDLPGSAGLPSN